MPELPEIINFKKYIDSTSLHQKIKNVKVNKPDILEGITPEKLKNNLVGTTFESTSWHGKYLFLQTGNSWELVLHFGMTGRPVYYKNDEKAPDYPRLFIQFDNGYRLAYDCMRMLGSVSLVKTREQFLRDKELGPDAMHEIDQPEKFVQLLEQRRGMIKTALMDQGLIAGIGNVCSDEILYQSGIHPKKAINKLTSDEIQTLYDNMHKVVEAIADTGLEYENLPDSFLLNHRSEDENCPACGETIKKEKVGGRSAYYCPKCQKK